jgi:hypothetical protein
VKVIGLYDWSGNNSILPELWIVPYFLPIHPGIVPQNIECIVGLNLFVLRYHWSFFMNY